MIDSTDKIGTVSYNGVPLEVDKNLTTKTITQNGTYNATTVDSVDGYSEVTVNVVPNVGTKSITTNGTYTSSTDSLDGYSEVTVNVTAQPNLGTKSITENGTYTASSDSLDGYSSVTVNVQGGGGSATLVTKTVTSNGTYAATDDSADGYSSVTVAVPDYFQMYVTNYQGTEGLFMNTPLTDQELAAMLNGVSVYNMENMFAGSSIVVAPMFDTTNVYAANMAFSYCDLLTTVPAYDFSNVTDMMDMFDMCESLEEINIQNIKVDFNISASSNFTLVALQTILGNLYDVGSEGESATLTMSSDSLALLSQSDIDAANAKGWTITD